MSARSNFISSIVILSVTLIFFWQIFSIEEDPFGHGMDPDTFPLAVGIILIALCSCFVLSSFFAMYKEKKQADSKVPFILFGRLICNLPSELHIFVVWVLPMAAIAFMYVGLITLIQYLVPSIICLSATLALFGNRGTQMLFVIPTISMTLYYVIFFGILRLSEPRGLIFEFDNFYIFGTLRKLIGI